MGKILSIHSYRGGTGKSNLSANIAWLMAKRGLRVGVLDTDLQSPGVHMVFGMDPQQMVFTLTDYLFGRCEMQEAAYDQTQQLGLQDSGGALFVLPSSMKVEALTRIVAESYDVSLLNDQFDDLMEELALDYLLLDSHPGLTKETMLSTAISHGLILVLRPDTQDYQGTAVLMQVASKLGVPDVFMIANKVPSALEPGSVRQRVEEAYGHEVLAVLPLSEELAMLGSRGLFADKFPEGECTRHLQVGLDRLIERMEHQDGQGS